VNLAPAFPFPFSSEKGRRAVGTPEVVFFFLFIFLQFIRSPLSLQTLGVEFFGSTFFYWPEWVRVTSFRGSDVVGVASFFSVGRKLPFLFFPWY